MRGKLSKYVVSISLGAIAIMLIMWSNITTMLPWLSEKQLLGTGLGFLVAAFIYLDNRINKLSLGPPVTITHLNLNECFGSIEKRQNHIKHLRIFANTTTIVQPAFANTRLSVGKCDILIRLFEHGEVDQNKELKNHINHLIEEWKVLKNKGRIKKLTIRGYNFLPTEWQVIVDKRVAICGLNSPDLNNWRGIDIEEPILVEDVTRENRMLLEKYIRRFDKFFSQYEDKQLPL